MSEQEKKSVALPRFGDGDPLTNLYGRGFVDGLQLAAGVMQIACEFRDRKTCLPKVATLLLGEYRAALQGTLGVAEEVALKDLPTPIAHNAELSQLAYARLAEVYGGLGALELGLLQESVTESDAIYEFSEALSALVEAADAGYGAYAEGVLFDGREPFDEDGELIPIPWDDIAQEGYE